jgi:hypothetical protein
MSDDVVSDFGELDMVQNVGEAVGIASIALPVLQLKTSSGFLSVMSM